MLKEYECKNCGYDIARWRINITGSRKDFCENCYSRYTSNITHVTNFKLNVQKKSIPLAKKLGGLYERRCNS